MFGTRIATSGRARIARVTFVLPALVLALSAQPVLADSQTVKFDALEESQGQPLNGSYPSGLIDWGSDAWYISPAWGAFGGMSTSFNGGDEAASQSFSFLGSHQLIQIDAYNGGDSATTITLSCPGQSTVSAQVGAGGLQTIQTGWSGSCPSVTVSSSNGWNTNFDNLVVS